VPDAIFVGIVSAMKTIVDRAGRIVVPKPLQRALGLRVPGPAAQRSRPNTRRGFSSPMRWISAALNPAARRLASGSWSAGGNESSLR